MAIWLVAKGYKSSPKQPLYCKYCYLQGCVFGKNNGMSRSVNSRKSESSKRRTSPVVTIPFVLNSALPARKAAK